MGKLARDGRGVDQNMVEAVAWFSAAASQGHAGAQNHLGVRYMRGEGVGQDDVLAFKWIFLAAEQGNASAILNRNALQMKMPPAEIAKAKALALKEKPAARPSPVVSVTAPSVTN